MNVYPTFARAMEYDTFVSNNMAEPIFTVGHDDDGKAIPDVSFWANGTVSFGTTYGFGSVISTYPHKYRFPFSVMSIISSIYNNSPDKETFESLQHTLYDGWFRGLPDCVYDSSVRNAELGRCPISKNGVNIKRLGEICHARNYYTPIMEVEVGGSTFFISLNGYITLYAPFTTISFDDMKRLIHISEMVTDIMHDGKYPFDRDVNEISVEEFEKLFSE